MKMIRRSKSTGALDAINVNFVDSKGVKCFDNDFHNWSAGEPLDRLNKSQCEEIFGLKLISEKLKGTLLDHQCKLRMIRDDFNMSHSLKEIITVLLEESEKTLGELEISTENVECSESASSSPIEPKHLQTVDKEIREALSKFSKYLQGDELRDHIAYNAANMISDAIDNCLSETYSVSYLPICAFNTKLRVGEDSDDKSGNTSRPFDVLWDSIQQILTHKFVETGLLSESIEYYEPVTPNKEAKDHLATNESKQLQTADYEMKEALLKLSKCLQSTELRDRIATSAAEAVSSVFDKCLVETLSKSTKTPENPPETPNVLETRSALLSDSMSKALQSVDEAFDKYNEILDSSNPPSQGSKVKKLREMLPKALVLQSTEKPLCEDVDGPYAGVENVLPSPPQPTRPDVSLIDHLMQSALINKQIREGSFNKSFEEVLSTCNLSLVMVACRAADPAKVFSPCSLSQSVLLSLVQQLATDMVHETQLKCRYLEEALINFDVLDEVTQTHLPLVVAEVRSHLSKFVRTYPNHVASRRIALIIMAADNLMK